jgi:lysozyme family protein
LDGLQLREYLCAEGEARERKGLSRREVRDEMTPKFRVALEKTLRFEGGYSNHPQDLGGATHYGVTQKTYDTWRVTTGKPKRAVELIEEPEVEAIYHDNYWLPCNCEALPDRLAEVVFDMAVNSGPWNAKLTLQRALMVRADGVFGPVTLRAAKETPDAVLRFLKRRGAFIQEILITRPSQVVFLEGWLNRLLDQAWRVS